MQGQLNGELQVTWACKEETSWVERPGSESSCVAAILFIQDTYLLNGWLDNKKPNVRHSYNSSLSGVLGIRTPLHFFFLGETI